MTNDATKLFSMTLKNNPELAQRMNDKIHRYFLFELEGKTILRELAMQNNDINWREIFLEWKDTKDD